MKTFFVYGSIVLFFIFVSLLIKTIFVIQESKFDDKHQFVLSISKNGELKEIIKFDPSMPEISVVQVKGKSSGIISDAKVNSTIDLPLGTNVGETIKAIGFRYKSITTNLTVFDIIRLIIFSYKTPANLVNENFTNNFFIDPTISSENISVQIINASGVSGLGKQQEEALTKLGFNIVAITTSRKEEKLSRIQYLDKETYTLKKLSKLLDFPLEKVEKEGIADIVVIIGKDNKISNF